MKKEETSEESTSEESMSKESMSEESDESNKTDRKETKSEVTGANVQRKAGSCVAPDYFNCFYCEQTFSTPNSLRYHLDYVHPWNGSSEGDSETKNEDVSSTEEMDNKNQEVNVRSVMKLCMDIRVKEKENLIEKMEGKREEKKENEKQTVDLEDLEVKETDELTEKKGEESEEKNKNENEEVTVDVMKQCLEENQELSPYRKDITTEDVEVKETQELAENKEEKREEEKENEAAVVNMMNKCLKERNEVVVVENDDLTEKKKEKSKEKNENNNESPDTSIVKVTNPKLLTLKDMPTRRP